MRLLLKTCDVISQLAGERPLSLDCLFSPALSLPPKGGNTWIRVFARRRLSLERGSQRLLPRRTVHRYVYASSKLAQSGECAYEIYSRLYNVGNAPPATLRLFAPPPPFPPESLHLLRILVFSQFRGKPRVSNIRSFIETHTSRILKSPL